MQWLRIVNSHFTRALDSIQLSALVALQGSRQGREKVARVAKAEHNGIGSLGVDLSITLAGSVGVRHHDGFSLQ